MHVGAEDRLADGTLEGALECSLDRVELSSPVVEADGHADGSLDVHSMAH